MAAAVGRGRSRGIRTTSRAPGTSPSIPPVTNIAPPSPVAIPPVVVPSPIPPVVAQSPLEAAVKSCLNNLRNLDKTRPEATYQDCINVISASIKQDPDYMEFVKGCVKGVYGNIPLTKNFVQFVCHLQQDKTVTFGTEITAKLLSSMFNEMNSLKPDNPLDLTPEMAVKLSSYTVLLSQVGLYIRRKDGNPITALAPHVLTCMMDLLHTPGHQDSVYKSVSEVLVQWGKTLELYLKEVSPNYVNDIQNLYDALRNIVISNETSDVSRVCVLELIERRAYDYTLPKHCQQYYDSTK